MQEVCPSTLKVISFAFEVFITEDALSLKSTMSRVCRNVQDNWRKLISPNTVQDNNFLAEDEKIFNGMLEINRSRKRLLTECPAWR